MLLTGSDKANSLLTRLHIGVVSILAAAGTRWQGYKVALIEGFNFPSFHSDTPIYSLRQDRCNFFYFIPSMIFLHCYRNTVGIIEKYTACNPSRNSSYIPIELVMSCIWKNIIYYELVIFVTVNYRLLGGSNDRWYFKRIPRTSGKTI